MSLSTVSPYTEPSFGLRFHNWAPSDVVLAVRIDYRWWLTPIIRTQAWTYTLSISEGATVEWRAISFRVYSLYNFVDVPHYSLDDFAAFRCDDLIEWQGQTTVSFGMLGRVAQIYLS
jgi:hypothetical protein